MLTSCLALCLLGGTVALARPQAAPQPAPESRDSVELVFAQPFRLDVAYAHRWRRERPRVEAGYLLVLAVDPERVHPRQMAEPVLCAGAQTVERLNVGFVPDQLPPGGRAHVVALVPAPLGVDGKIALDLERTTFWFGAPELPERVDAAWIEREARQAKVRGSRPPGNEVVRAALARSILFLPDEGELRRYAADLIERYSPSEVDLIAGLRVPRLR